MDMAGSVPVPILVLQHAYTSALAPQEVILLSLALDSDRHALCTMRHCANQRQFLLEDDTVIL